MTFINMPRMLAIVVVAMFAQSADAQPCGKSYKIAAALIPGVKLGHLFDWPNQGLLANKFWMEKKIADNTYQMWDSSEETDLFVELEADNKENTLDLAASISLSLMAGKLELAGSINYLKAELQDSLFSRLVLKTDKRTATEYLGEEIIQQSVGRSRHYDTEATHVVTKIDYGASAVITVDFDTDIDSSDTRFGGSFSITLVAGAAVISGSASLQFNETTADIFNRSTIEVHSDIPLINEATNWEEAKEAIKTFSTAMERTNGGLGIPKEVTLTPICYWQPDKYTKLALQLSDQAAKEIIIEFRRVINLKERARAVQRYSKMFGLPVLLAQAQDFELNVIQYLARIKLRYQLMIPKIRLGTLSETAFVEFILDVKNSPFSAYATERWLSMSFELIDMQVQIRRWIDVTSSSKVFHINSFGDLQRMLRSPQVDTVIAYALVGKPNSLQDHLTTMKKFLQDPESSGYSGVIKSSKYLQSPDNTLRTRQASGLLRDFVKSQSCALAGCDPSRQRVVFLDYYSYDEELTAMGAGTSTSALQIWDRGLLVNGQYSACASPSDPRDDKTSVCLWTGNGDIPNGNRCSSNIEDDSRGCENQCGVDGFCRAVQCKSFKENDWFMMQQRGFQENLFQQFSRFVSFELSDTLASVKSIIASEVESVMPRFRWVDPGLITLFDHPDLCLQVVRMFKIDAFEATAHLTTDSFKPLGTEDYEDEDFDYGTLTVRSCNKFVDYQRFELTSVWGFPRYRVVRPGVVDGVDYCITVNKEPNHVYMSVCSESNIEQIIWESFSLYVRGDNDDGNFRVKHKANVDLTLQTVSAAEEVNGASELFLWRGDRIGTFAPPKLYGGVVPPDAVQQMSFLVAGTGTDGDDDEVKLTETITDGTSLIIEGSNIKIRGFGTGNCLATGRASGIGDDSLFVLPCDTVEKSSGDFYDCKVEKCKSDTCIGLGPNAYCVSSQTEAPQCLCNPGTEVINDECANQDACKLNACQHDEYCVDLLPPAKAGPDGRVCLPRSGCPKGMVVSDMPLDEDVLCSACPEGTFQAEEGFLGTTCMPHSPSCKIQTTRNSPELVEQEPASDKADIVCKPCGTEDIVCKEPEFIPPQSKVPGLASGEEIAAAGEGSLSGNGGSPVVQTVDSFSGAVASATGDAADDDSITVASGVGLAPTTSFGDGSDIASRDIITGVPTLLVIAFGDGSSVDIYYAVFGATGFVLVVFGWAIVSRCGSKPRNIPTRD